MFERIHRPSLRASLGLLAAAGVLATAACGESEEAARYEATLATVAVDGPATNDLGWAVEVTELRAIVTQIELTTEGELHDGDDQVLSGVWDTVGGLFVGTAWAHPGHEAGGNVIGELGGRRVLVLHEAGEIGPATVLEARYDGINLTYGLGEAADALDADDPLLGASAVVIGTARREGAEVPFAARVVQDDGRRIVGIPLSVEVVGEGTRIGLSVAVQDPFEADTAFDGIDFAALETVDGVAQIAPGTDAHNRLRNALQTHDHWLGHSL